MAEELKPFRFDTEGSKLFGSVILGYHYGTELLRVFKDNDVDVSDIETLFNDYKEGITRIYNEYRAEDALPADEVIKENEYNSLLQKRDDLIKQFKGFIIYDWMCREAIDLISRLRPEDAVELSKLVEQKCKSEE